ncbi:MAG: C40 family peptidase [Nannocystaceae bacterium]|nr:C40 family peptidase [Nannocystaceae bacterium]
MSRARAPVIALLLASAWACERQPAVPQAEPEPSAPTCPAGPVAAAFAPGIDAALERASQWSSPIDETVLLDHAALTQLRARRADADDPWRAGWDGAHALLDAGARLSSYEAEIAKGELIETEPGALAAARALLEAAEPVDHARLVVRETQLWCAPLRGTLLSGSRDPAFDRNLCTSLHGGELVRVLARTDGGRWLLVDAGHTLGWLPPTDLSTRLREEDRLAWRGAPSLWIRRDGVRTEGGVELRMGVALPLLADEPTRARVQVAGPQGPVEDSVAKDDGIAIGALPLTRGAVVAAAFRQLGAPYGWGGRNGARDCSQWLRDLLLPFGVALPRHSSQQAQAGVTTVDVRGLSDADKLAAIERAAGTGLVLEYMPGHIMLDVGGRDGRRYAISAIAEFVTPCEGGGETLWRLDRVAVTDLETGRGSARGAFVERITTLAVLGPA